MIQLINIRINLQASQEALVVKNPPANAGDDRDKVLIPELGRSSGVGNSNLLQNSCLENTIDKEAWRATAHGTAKQSDRSDHTQAYE